jgi:hypothetical protein
MKVAFFILFLSVTTSSFSQNLPGVVLDDLKKSSSTCLEGLPSESVLQSARISARDYTTITKVRNLCKKILSMNALSGSDLIELNKQLNEALNPTVHLNRQTNASSSQYGKIVVTIDGDKERCEKNCSNKFKDCCEKNPDPQNPFVNGCESSCAGDLFGCGLGCIKVKTETSKPIVQSVKVESTIEKIQCIATYDGRKDQIEEVYGRIEILRGSMCFDGDIDRHPPLNIKGNGFWERKPEDFIRMKKRNVVAINQTISWTYLIPPGCGTNSNQTLVECRSNLDERDMPSNADDKLEGGCSGANQNHYCSSVVYLNDVMQGKPRSYKFVHTHSSGGTILEVHFKVVITPVTSKSISQTPGTGRDRN